MVTLYACSELQIYVVDSLDRERIGKAKAEFQVYKLSQSELLIAEFNFFNQVNIEQFCCRQ
jgi:hypothetical protein